MLPVGLLHAFAAIKCGRMQFQSQCPAIYMSGWKGRRQASGDRILGIDMLGTVAFGVAPINQT